MARLMLACAAAAYVALVNQVSAIEQVWVKHEGTDCYSGKGADDIEPEPYANSTSLDNCKAACKNDSTCEGIIRKTEDQQNNGTCYLRKNINLKQCSTGSIYTLHQNPGAWLKNEGAACVSFLSADYIGLKPYYDSISLDNCKAMCMTLLMCDGIVRKTEDQHNNGKCHLRKNISLQECITNPGYTTHLKPGGSSYVARENGPGCSEGFKSITSSSECQAAAAFFGFTGEMHVGNWNHAPPGCHVGHPTDGWAHIYFNEYANGRTGRSIYKSICHHQNGCPNGWSRYQNSCYKLFTSGKAWPAARDHCRSLQAELASIHSSGENDFIYHMKSYGYVWLGGTDEPMDGNWTWVDGSDWDYGDLPDGGSSTNALIMLDYGSWYDSYGDDANPFVCKMN